MAATELKIDRTFVERGDDPTARTLRAVLIALARSLDLTVVAEGIETPSQLATLRDLGCDLLQGLYLSAPLLAEEARAAPADVTALLPPSS